MKRLATAAALALLVVSGATELAAQQRVLRVEGRVQWLAGQTVTIAVPTGEVIAVDLSRIPLQEYLAIRTRDRVIVTGVLAEDDNRIIGTSLTRVSSASLTPAGLPATSGAR